MGTMIERNGKGQFGHGNRGGPGRPKRQTEREYLHALRDVVSLDAWQRIVARAVFDAEAGDGKAREWLARYLIGDVANVATLEGLSVADLESHLNGLIESCGLRLPGDGWLNLAQQSLEERRQRLLELMDRIVARQGEPEYLDYLRDKAAKGGQSE